MKKSLYVTIFDWLARRIFPACEIKTKEELPDEPAVYLCNHSAAVGPALMTLWFNKPHRTWIVSFALDKKLGPNYFYHDAFFGRGRKCKWFWRLLSKIVMPMLRPLLKQGEPIPVYHDRRIVEAFRESVAAMEEGKSIVIFPESPVRYSEYVHTVYDGFADIGRAYYTKTGKCLKFYPVYAEKKNRVISVGTPIEYDPTLPPREQRRVIAEHIQTGIDSLARELPPHKPVPFLPEFWYKYYGEYEHDVASYWKLFE